MNKSNVLKVGIASSVLLATALCTNVKVLGATNDVINEDERVKGQAYMGITSIIGGILGNFLGGVIIEKSSVIIMLYFTLLIGIIGMIIILMAVKKMKLIVIDNWLNVIDFIFKKY